MISSIDYIALLPVVIIIFWGGKKRRRREGKWDAEEGKKRGKYVTTKRGWCRETSKGGSSIFCKEDALDF